MNDFDRRIDSVQLVTSTFSIIGIKVSVQIMTMHKN